jgi:glycosyltransferase involved in cell wall biosynthesis
MLSNKIAILLSTYNGEKYICDMLESLSRQTERSFDLFIRDDGSIDNTIKLINSYNDLLSIRLTSGNENLGVAKSFIELLKQVSPDYELYMFADQDDWWKPEKIERTFLASKKIEKCVPFLYCSALDIVDSNLQFIYSTSGSIIPSKYNALVENIATGCTIGINSTARQLLLKKLPNRYAMHDWWFYVVVSFFGIVYYDSKSTIKYRQHNTNLVGHAIGVWSDLARRVLRFQLKPDTGIFLVNTMADQFLECFGDRLSQDDLMLVKMLTKNNYFQNFLLSVSSPFFRQRFIDNAILRFLFLIGRY